MRKFSTLSLHIKEHTHIREYFLDLSSDKKVSMTLGSSGSSGRSCSLCWTSGLGPDRPRFSGWIFCSARGHVVPPRDVRDQLTCQAQAHEGEVDLYDVNPGLNDSTGRKQGLPPAVSKGWLAPGTDGSRTVHAGRRGKSVHFSSLLAWVGLSSANSRAFAVQCGRPVDDRKVFRCSGSTCVLPRTTECDT